MEFAVYQPQVSMYLSVAKQVSVEELWSEQMSSFVMSYMLA